MDALSKMAKSSLMNGRTILKSYIMLHLSKALEEIHPAKEDLIIEQGDFTSVELKKAISGLNNFKAPGVGFSITAEALKYGGPALEEKLLTLTNFVMNNLTPLLQ